jgi:hypothetical protein
VIGGNMSDIMFNPMATPYEPKSIREEIEEILRNNISFNVEAVGKPTIDITEAANILAALFDQKLAPYIVIVNIYENPNLLEAQK